MLVTMLHDMRVTWRGASFWSALLMWVVALGLVSGHSTATTLCFSVRIGKYWGKDWPRIPVGSTTTVYMSARRHIRKTSHLASRLSFKRRRQAIHFLRLCIRVTSVIYTELLLRKSYDGRVHFSFCGGLPRKGYPTRLAGNGHQRRTVISTMEQLDFYGRPFNCSNNAEREISLHTSSSM
jgi:hypothetical protein